ncbi:MAG TPA: MmoB/DmpM family protein [Solirubrobacteraceae bacterium]|nr:MmoB/DmpM family protein [Solirubrobacteraceae bacterium]
MRARLEPIGVEIECGRDETVLDAAFRQGYNLVYGCREGQCSACKCFLLEGDVALKPYSTFALSDSERANGYALMCRAMPEQDLVVELLHYDPDAYRLEHAITDGSAIVELVEPLTHDIVALVLRCASAFEFTPGQYIDVHVPGADGARRSFSMANLPADGLIELIIKRYPGGRFSGLLDGRIAVGDELGFTGPYGSLRVRESERPVLMIAGGSGMAPILSLLRQLAREQCSRPVRFFYGARSDRDLFYVSEIEQLGARLPDFRFTPIVDQFVHHAVDGYLAGGEIAQPDVYMCGPPPMIEAAEQMLVGTHGIDEQRIFSDKFTTAAEAAPVSSGAGAASERDFGWFVAAGRHATLYEDVTIDTQPSVHRHLRRGWPVSFEDGRGTWDDASTALRCADWFAFRDPGEQWERPFYQQATALERQIQGAMRLVEDFSPQWVELLRARLQVSAFVEHGLWFALATIGRSCLSDTVATCVCLQAAMKQRSAQAIVLYAMDLERHHGPFPIEPARDTFVHDERWQPTRRYLERLAATPDWGEVIVACNLCFEPLVGTLLRREFGIRRAAANGDTVTPVLAGAATQEWEWAQAWTHAFVHFVSADPDHGERNRAAIERWVADWEPRGMEAARALAPEIALEAERFDHVAVAAVPAGESTRRVRPAPTRRRPAAARDADSSYDYVGIVMAKSAEGDAVAEILGRREEVDVIEQPAFWDIRARDRLTIAYAEVSDELGYEIDAYSIQHEMSTHYGRMVATDDALMLFSDPTEAMQYLMS